MTDIMTVHHDFTIDVDGLTMEQLDRLNHHLLISRRVFEASARSMVKGVRKYGPEPEEAAGLGRFHTSSQLETNAANAADYWLPHIFSEAVDGANQTGLFADTLGVEL
jgi:hypothetical protein